VTSPASVPRRDQATASSGALGWIVLAAIIAVHVWTSTGAIAPGSLATDEPFYPDDYVIHFARASAIAAALPHTGRLWLYDPSTMAGYPLGATLLDLDNAGTAVLMAAMHPLGAARAFKAVVCLFLVLTPLAVWLTARRLGATSAEAIAATAASVVVAASAITFRIGMFSHFAASVLAPLVVAVADRHLAQPRVRTLAALVLVGAAGLLVHVVVGVLVLLPCALLVLGHAARAPGRTLAQAILATLGLVLLSTPWLVPFVRFAPVLGWEYHHHFFQTATLAGAWTTFRVLAGWHLLLLALAAIGWVSWSRRVGAVLAGTYAIWLVALLAATFQGSRIPVLARLEPAHLVVPLAFALCPLAGIGAVELLRRARLPAAAVLAVAPLVFVPHLVVTLRKVAPLPPIAARLPDAGYAFLDWLRTHTDPSARILIEDRFHLERPPLDRNVPEHPYFGGHLLALLPRLIGRETIGGPYAEMPIRPHRADFSSGRFFGTELAAWTPDRFADALGRYNVGWIVAWSSAATSYFDAHPGIVEPIGAIGSFRAYRTRERSSFFFVGSGRVDARPNAIEVHDASPGGVVLKYHWYPGFCSDPPLPIAAYHAADLAAPFIAVDNGTERHFTLHPTRGWLGRCG